MWVSPCGGALPYSTIWRIFIRHTARHLGIRIAPHDCRDAGATTWAIAAPDQIGIARDLLGHSDLRTTITHYNRARGIEASRAYRQVIEKYQTMAAAAELGAPLLWRTKGRPAACQAAQVFFVALLPRSWLKLGKSFQNAGEQLGGLIRGAAVLMASIPCLNISSASIFDEIPFFTRATKASWVALKAK